MLFGINEIISRELSDMKRIYKLIWTYIEQDKEMVSEKVELTGKSGESLTLKCTSEGYVYKKHFRCNGKQHVVKLGGENNKEVIRIKQRKFNEVMLERLKKNIELLETIDGRFLPYDPGSIDEQLSPVYRDGTGLVNKAPGMVDLKEWNKIVKRNGYDMPKDPDIAPDGLNTRSKSEIIVYGILKGYGLIVKYDFEITLIDETGHPNPVSPDFIILCNDGSMIIIEHMGLMDDIKYLDKKIKRIHLYQINGYKLNDTLFLTSDYAKGKIDARVIDELVRKMILPRANGTAA